jgi:hypothetical protein
MMGNIMHFQQVLRQSNTKDFVPAVIKEVNRHVNYNNWTLQKQSEVPEDA